MSQATSSNSPQSRWRGVAAYALLALVPMLAALVLALHRPAASTSAAAASVAATPWLESLSTPLAHFLLQILVILLVAKAAGWLLRRLGQPSVIGEMAAGLMLGPLLLGQLWPQAQQWLFAAPSLGALGLVSQLGVLMFLFVAGAELDLSALRGRRRLALLVSHAGIALPFLFGVGLALALFSTHAPAATGFAGFAMFLGVSLSVTAFPVLLRILSDRGMIGTDLGQVAIACAALGDATAWCLLALIVAAAQMQGTGVALANLACLAAFVALMLGIVRPWLTRWQIAPQNEGRGLIVLLWLAMCGALVTEALGIHALFGAFLAGVAASHNPRLRELLMLRVAPLAMALLLPLFFAMTGLRMRPESLQVGDLGLCLFIIFIATAGKLLGSFAAARSCGMARAEAWRLGALMNTRGLMELIVLNLGYDLGLIDDRLFAVLVVMALVTTAMTGPLLSLIDRIASRRAA